MKKLEDYRKSARRSVLFGPLCTCLALFASPRLIADGEEADGATRLNIILCMTDDQGWADVGYRGHEILKTPNLDAMSRSGLRFERWYAGAPVCSPTRGSCLTGRHPYRYGVVFANAGHLKPEEICLAEMLKDRGYRTGHFGKWHLGTLTTTEKDSNRGGRPGSEKHYSPPWKNGFDVCFSTEAKVPTYDPMVSPDGEGRAEDRSRRPYGTYYWTGPEQKATENLEGDDSRIIMDRVIPFIERSTRDEKPFLAVVWFHTPHLPTVAGPRHLERYRDAPEPARHYLGCITAMDEQMGRLRAKLRQLGVARDTMLWFTSDNGPEGRRRAPSRFGSAGPLRGRKRSLHEGGVRVPGLLEWPARVAEPRVVSMPCSTLDYLPTILEALGGDLEEFPHPLDGVSLLPLIDGRTTERPRPIPFESGGQVALVENRYKIYSSDRGRTYQLYDIESDPAETTDLSAEKPEVLERMRSWLERWRESCRASNAGKDYRSVEEEMP